MDEFGSGCRRSGNDDRRVGVVSGKSFSASQVGSKVGARPPHRPQPVRTRVTGSGYGSQTSPSSKPWRSSSDSETKRRKRIAKYNVYSVEGKVKASLKNGFRWFKNKCSQIVHGF